MGFNPHARVGRDNFFIHIIISFKRFNPHARVGRDESMARIVEKAVVVSIHTPAWGVTYI